MLDFTFLVINANGGYEYNIAPLFKRFLAELVDVLILFLIKLMVTFAIVDLFDIKLGIDLDFDSIKNSLEDDYTELLSFTSDLVIAETITKIVVCFYEALWTASGGATPGKMLLGIRILYVEAVVPLEPQQQMLNMNQNQAPLKALLYPASNPGFRRSLVRAIAKNIIMTIL
jgi:RDD family